MAKGTRTTTARDTASTRAEWPGWVIGGLALLFLLATMVTLFLEADAVDAGPSGSRVVCLGSPARFAGCGMPFQASSL